MYIPQRRPTQIALGRASKRFLLAVVVIGAAVLAGCASAPVQEMSDARQAIRAAQEAGAADKAAKSLVEAQGALTRAESQLSKRYFGAARRNAIEAHAKAVQALQQARDARPRE